MRDGCGPLTAKNPAALLAIALFAMHCRPKDWVTFAGDSVCAAVPRSQQVGAFKLVSGRPVTELTSGGEGGGEDDGEDVWMEMDAGMVGSGVDADCCWLERRGSDLGWGWGLAFDALWRIDDDL